MSLEKGGRGWGVKEEGLSCRHALGPAVRSSYPRGAASGQKSVRDLGNQGEGGEGGGGGGAVKEGHHEEIDRKREIGVKLVTQRKYMGESKENYCNRNRTGLKENVYTGAKNTNRNALYIAPPPPLKKTSLSLLWHLAHFFFLKSQPARHLGETQQSLK